MNKIIVKKARWENVLNIILGSWIFFIPWVLGFGFEKYETNTVMWNYSIVGAVVIVSSIFALRKFNSLPEWISFVAGAWLFVSPLFLIYYEYTLLLWNSLIFGLLISGLSALGISIAEKPVFHRIFKRNLLLKEH